MDTTRAATLPGGVRPEVGMGIYNQKLGMWIFLASEVMFFTGLIGAYIILRFGTEEWAEPGQVLDIWVTAANTFLLICSSVTMVKAYAAAVDGNPRQLRLFLALTALLGATFVSVQGYEYFHLAHDKGFLPRCTELGAATIPNCHLYGSTFYTMTGFHGTHVTIGVLCMLFVTWKAFRGKYGPDNYGGVETVGLYWHFVDLVWIILFTIVYLI